MRSVSMSRKMLAAVLAAVLCVLFLAGCERPGRQDMAADIGSWQELSQCAPSLSVVGNSAGCGLFVRGRSFDTRIGANLRLQRLEGGGWRTVRLWYGLSGEGELDFADRCWLNEGGSYRLSGEVWAGELEPVWLYADLQLGDLPERADGEEPDYQTVNLFAFELPEETASLSPELWEEIIATARTEADRYYNTAPGLLLRYADSKYNSKYNNEEKNEEKNEMILPGTVVNRLAEALEQGELRQVALELEAGRVCFLDGGVALRGLAAQLGEADRENAAGLELWLAADNKGDGFAFGFREADTGRKLALNDRVLVYGALGEEFAGDWEQRSEPREIALYGDWAVVDGKERPCGLGDIVYRVEEDAVGRVYARVLTAECGRFEARQAKERYSGDYLNYLAGRNAIAPEDFAPERAISRGELVELLYRLAGEPEENTAGAAFIDVPVGSEYDRAALWARERGLITGFADGSFRPAEKISKQEMLVILWRYVTSEGTCLPHNREDIRYYDRGRIGGFAREAVSAFSEAGLAPREDWRRLGPRKQATWEEAARLAALVNQSILNGLEQFVLK